MCGFLFVQERGKNAHWSPPRTVFCYWTLSRTSSINFSSDREHSWRNSEVAKKKRSRNSTLKRKLTHFLFVIGFPIVCVCLWFDFVQPGPKHILAIIRNFFPRAGLQHLPISRTRVSSLFRTSCLCWASVYLFVGIYSIVRNIYPVHFVAFVEAVKNFSAWMFYWICLIFFSIHFPFGFIFGKAVRVIHERDIWPLIPSCICAPFH